jgi:methylglyoxal synthase
MTIAFMAHGRKKELMIQFCKAYQNELEKHTLVATATTGKLIAEHTGLPVKLLLSHKQGGHQQVNTRISYNEFDMVIMLLDPDIRDPEDNINILETLRSCERNNIPLATNLASAEMLILSMERGELDWRELIHSRKKFYETF